MLGHKTKVTRASQDVTGTLAPKQILILQIVFKFFKTEKTLIQIKYYGEYFGIKAKGMRLLKLNSGFRTLETLPVQVLPLPLIGPMQGTSVET